MKLIEALKKIKDLKRKAADLRLKVRDNSAYLSNMKSPYEDPVAQVSEWIQAHNDILKEILKLRIAIQKTNLATMVEIEMPDGTMVTKNLAEWIIRNRELAGEERMVWEMLSEQSIRSRGLKESETTLTTPPGAKEKITIERNFSAAERDTNIMNLASEPSVIDSRLEIVNAVTDVIGYEPEAEAEAGA